MATNARTNTAKSAQATTEKVEPNVEALVENIVLDVPVIDLSPGEARILSAMVAAEYKAKKASMADAKRDVTSRTAALMALVSLKKKLDTFVSAFSENETSELPDSI